jgi:hypothetical protein
MKNYTYNDMDFVHHHALKEDHITFVSGCDLIKYKGVGLNRLGATRYHPTYSYPQARKSQAKLIMCHPIYFCPQARWCQVQLTRCYHIYSYPKARG